MKVLLSLFALFILLPANPASALHQWIISDSAAFNGGNCVGDHNVIDVIQGYAVRLSPLLTGARPSAYEQLLSNGWNWAEVDRLVATNSSYGYQIYYTPGGNDLESKRADGSPLLDFTQMLVVWSNYLRQIAARYHPYAIEVYNESSWNDHVFGANDNSCSNISETGYCYLPNSEFVANYGRVYANCYRAIKAASPSTLVVAHHGSFVPGRPGDSDGQLALFRNAILSQGVPLEAFAFHDTRNCDERVGENPAGRLFQPEATNGVVNGVQMSKLGYLGSVDQMMDTYRQVFAGTILISGEWHNCSGTNYGDYASETDVDVSRAVRFVTMWRGGGVVAMYPIASASCNQYAGGISWCRSGQGPCASTPCAPCSYKDKWLATAAASAWMDGGTGFVHTNLNREVFIYAWRAKGRTVACFWTPEGISKRSVSRTVMSVFGKKYSTSIVREHPQYVTFLLKSPEQAVAALAQQFK
jgi:hypothetical protein